MTAVVYLLAAVGLFTLAAGAVFAVAPDWALDLIEITFRGPWLGGWMPGQFECPNGHVPAPGERWPEGV